jgi:hypothetical protein
MRKIFNAPITDTTTIWEANQSAIAYSQNALVSERINAPITDTTTIWEANQSAIAYSQNALVSEGTKLIDLKWHFLVDHVEHRTIKLKYLPTY